MNEYAKYTLQLQKCSEMKLKRNLELLVIGFNPGPECTANPIKVTPIWKWEFANGKALCYAYGALQPHNKRSKIQFTHERLEMRHKMDLHKLG